MRQWLILGAASAFLSVAAGAFGAHALRARLTPDLLTIFETGARYHMYHSLGLIAIGLLSQVRPHPLLNGAGWAMTVGILLFSGSLYALALSGVRALGAITPLGGLGFLAGWLLLAIAAWRQTG
ncbi:DUF423 domain-containing protein [Archangium violaceum]|uniref:Membrane protein n=1 Tax=Archangium violaceum Cb vi76 TaxID=1406225 RepID=A0A084SLU1_9BACT|nr:DUF423 domain-containing protein [Archangium violaceum]KFA89426.1 membrane protein [Archangium violaceum Cb vi76]WNG59792.1 DUF423 domain-containing protein [Archangium gephyra]